MLPSLEKEAARRMSEGGKGREKIPDPGEARDKAAKQAIKMRPKTVEKQIVPMEPFVLYPILSPTMCGRITRSWGL